MTPQEIITCVKRLEETADQTIGWISRGGRCCGTKRVDGFCTNTHCRDRAIWAAGLNAREAARCALQLIRLSESVAGGEVSVVFDPDVFERIAAFMGDTKR